MALWPDDRRSSIVTGVWAAVALSSQLIYAFALAPLLPTSYVLNLLPREWRPDIFVETATVTSVGWFFALGIAVLAVFSIVATIRGDVVGGFGFAFGIALVAPVGVTILLTPAALELAGLDSTVTAYLIVVALAVGLLSFFALRGRRPKGRRSPASPGEPQVRD